MSKEIITKERYDIDKPDQVSKMAIVLKDHIVKNKLYTTIVGKNYAHVEGWQFAGGIMGLFPKIKAVENLSAGSEYKWKAEVEIIDRRTGAVVSTGFAICSNKEGTKKNFAEYAVLSMAQTRAIGKAYRNLLGWVMKLAGYSGTPAEEMVRAGETMPEPAVQYQSSATPAKNKVSEPLFCVGLRKGGCPDGRTVSEAESNYSLKIFKKQLCRACQKEAK